MSAQVRIPSVGGGAGGGDRRNNNGGRGGRGGRGGIKKWYSTEKPLKCTYCNRKGHATNRCWFLLREAALEGRRIALRLEADGYQRVHEQAQAEGYYQQPIDQQGFPYQQQEQWPPTEEEVLSVARLARDRINDLENQVAALELENARLRQDLEARSSSDMNTGDSLLPKGEDGQDEDLGRPKEEKL